MKNHIIIGVSYLFSVFLHLTHITHVKTHTHQNTSLPETLEENTKTTLGGGVKLQYHHYVLYVCKRQNNNQNKYFLPLPF